MIIEDLSEYVSVEGELVNKLVFAPLAFSMQLEYEKHIKDHNVSELYFPLNINNNHWIVGCVDFEKSSISYGDPIDSSLSKPKKLHQALKGWLQTTFSRKFTFKGNTLPHGRQKDSFSCSIILANTLEHVISGVPLWEQRRSILECVEWFLCLGNWVSISDTEMETMPNEPDQAGLTQAASIVLALGDHNFPDLCHFALSPDLAGPTDHDIKMNDDAVMAKSRASASVKGAVNDSKTSNDEIEEDQPGSDVDSGDKYHTDRMDEDKPKMESAKKQGNRLCKRSRSSSDSSSSNESDPDQRRGQNRSGKAAHKLRKKKLREGKLEVDNVKYDIFKGKILAINQHAEFYSDNICRVHHSRCGKDILMKDLLLAMWGKKTTGPAGAKKAEKVKQGVKPETKKFTKMYPRPGITVVDDKHMPIYLKRKGVAGGGARSVKEIAGEFFGKLFSKLGHKHKAEVLD
ncbi:hypothetical protein DXG01_015132 [Tephrocybe rancida]|nr:hypothetical protein DXG01_015132 [Tephrocybe rancida]